ncbi:MAG: PIN domain nuclease [Geodermatophilaceae bacterium]|nr:PIN domain nuclease [Geodermatophilaceae bacterium]MDQ3463586.1 PIN domain nuclease [Actinomycetota bacterium]
MTVLLDSSAWVEFLRATDSPVHRAVRHELAEGSAATTDAVLLELLIGPSGEDDALRLARMLAGCEQLSQDSPGDVESAAGLYRQCRRAGETPRSVLDCVIAAVAIRHDVALLHRDRDFDVLARHTPLRVVSAPDGF